MSMITLQEAKEFLRVDGDDEENLIASLIVAARELTEDVLRRPLAEIEPLKVIPTFLTLNLSTISFATSL